MTLVVVTPPAPIVSLAEVKRQARVESAFTDDDDLFTGLIAAATAALDGPGGWLGRALGRVLAEDDPLRAGRLAALVTEELGRGPMRATATASGQAAVVGGTLRIGPLAVEAGPTSWSGNATFDLKSLRLDARGALTSRTAPKDWSGAAPAIRAART
jgi:hypothetical protein